MWYEDKPTRGGFLVLLFLRPRGRKPLCGLGGKPRLTCSVPRVPRSPGQFYIRMEGTQIGSTNAEHG